MLPKSSRSEASQSYEKILAIVRNSNLCQMFSSEDLTVIEESKSVALKIKIWKWRVTATHEGSGSALLLETFLWHLPIFYCLLKCPTYCHIKTLHCPISSTIAKPQRKLQKYSVYVIIATKYDVNSTNYFSASYLILQLNYTLYDLNTHRSCSVRLLLLLRKMKLSI